MLSYCGVRSGLVWQEKGDNDMKKYSWKNAGFNANVQRVGEELEGLEKTKEITNKNVLEYAKNNYKI